VSAATPALTLRGVRSTAVEVPLRFENGCVVPREGAGTGLSWDERAVAHHRLE
jgi:hypothetical protein